MLPFFKNLKTTTKGAKGLSLIEVVVVLFVVTAVGVLAAPIVFPGDAKSPDAQIRSDIDLLKEIMDLRMTSYDITKTGGLSVEANIGVYAAYAQFEGKATLDAAGKPAFYCLRGTHPSGLTLFFNSKDGAVTETPTDPAGCPGGATAPEGTEEVPADGATDSNGVVTDPADGSAPAETSPPTEAGEPAVTPIPENTQSGANN